MNFKEGLLFAQNNLIVKENTAKYAKSFTPPPLSQNPALKILYPGKLSKGDYKLTFNNHALSHVDIVNEIYTFIISETDKKYERAIYISKLLADIFNYGLNAQVSTINKISIKGTLLNMSEFKEIIYWITLQEDINYPRPRYMGIKMPFIRYIESAISAIHPDIISIDEVITRTNNHGTKPTQAINNEYISYDFLLSLMRIR
ncbi:hypothetical protein D6T70_11335 [Kurthia gibsonii]|uniref:Uncharacterized protein n=1 Tax=Kurthia gibsonii TaxID=33946 RepID=A0ABU9LLL0_9BACL|nr:hypothetical protein [Kurthia gibsonii]RXH51504.1 hypothetical protein D6T70_11335 [Kurthia gibsonii]